MGMIKDLMKPFIEAIAAGSIEIYNEYSLQHELGFFIRGRLPNHKVQFERNVSFFFRSSLTFIKREIDITIIDNATHKLDCAIELKYPRNGQYPEQMFSFCKDIAFAEELNAAGFSTAGLLIFADDRLFYEGSQEGIYGFFRGGVPLRGRIQKPTGRRDDELTLRGNYLIEWEQIVDSLRFAVIEVGK